MLLTILKLIKWLLLFISACYVWVLHRFLFQSISLYYVSWNVISVFLLCLAIYSSCNYCCNPSVISNKYLIYFLLLSSSMFNIDLCVFILRNILYSLLFLFMKFWKLVSGNLFQRLLGFKRKIIKCYKHI